jgi:hypothetical protein
VHRAPNIASAPARGVALDTACPFPERREFIGALRPHVVEAQAFGFGLNEQDTTLEDIVRQQRAANRQALLRIALALAVALAARGQAQAPKHECVAERPRHRDADRVIEWETGFVVEQRRLVVFVRIVREFHPDMLHRSRGAARARGFQFFLPFEKGRGRRANWRTVILSRGAFAPAWRLSARRRGVLLRRRAALSSFSSCSASDPELAAPFGSPRLPGFGRTATVHRQPAPGRRLIVAAGRSPDAARVQGLLALRAGADPIPTSRRNRFASPHRDRARLNISLVQGGEDKFFEIGGSG